MCGIVGYVGPRNAVSFLMPALRRLEYRGYDSAGVATLNGRGLEVCKVAGKVTSLEMRIGAALPRGTAGIAHTRWATHGAPSEANAHPHVDCAGCVGVVHNGIIENYRELRARLTAEGHCFRSETDSEVIAHLVERHLSLGLAGAVAAAAAELRGSFAIACISEIAPDEIVAVRRGDSPLVLGRNDDECFLASDIPALLGETRQISVLETDELAVLRRSGPEIRTMSGKLLSRCFTSVHWDADSAEKNGHPHFMRKEIFEQPEAVRRTFADRVDPALTRVALPELTLDDAQIRKMERVCFVACGTSLHAGMIGRYLTESLACISTDVEIASEHRYRDTVLDGKTLTIAISQSGETADTLAALRAARARGSFGVAVCNVVGSSIAREADSVLYTRAGLELGVASTKAFTAQITALFLLALRLADARQTMEPTRTREMLHALAVLPDQMQSYLCDGESIQEVARRFSNRRSFLFIGRGLDYPLALEGALKLKEISYLHAEGYAAGELKHGPIALIEKGVPVVALAPSGPHYEKMCSNVEEVCARRASVIAIVDREDSDMASLVDTVIRVPRTNSCLQPLLTALPLQLLAYHIGVHLGRDVDQPRNLAKSVTVE
jgi:glucosamine--fructose-6-phosphate aminotransferase (isomerizing)